jgi:molybdenum cofactor cytidylyltransferase
METESEAFSAVILAAGMSRRMGSPKALLDLDGKTLICRLIDTVREVEEMNQIIVVTGHEPQRIQQAVEPAGARIDFAQNDAYEAGGMLSSIKVGVAAIRNECRAFFLMLLDQPLVRAQTLVAMSHAWVQRHPLLVVPAHQGRRGHPILISADCVQSILALAPDATLRDFVAQNRDLTEILDVEDPGILTGVDTPDDYKSIIKLLRDSKSM